jgi:hypothetical protein
MASECESSTTRNDEEEVTGESMRTTLGRAKWEFQEMRRERGEERGERREERGERRERARERGEATKFLPCWVGAMGVAEGAEWVWWEITPERRANQRRGKQIVVLSRPRPASQEGDGTGVVCTESNVQDRTAVLDRQYSTYTVRGNVMYM